MIGAESALQNNKPGLIRRLDSRRCELPSEHGNLNVQDIDMAEKEKNSARSRLTLDLSTRMTEFLSTYAEKKGITKAEALRSAVELLSVADDAAEEGLKVGAWGGADDRRIERQFVGL